MSNITHPFFYCCSYLFGTVPGEIAAEEKEMSEANRMLKKELEKMNKRIDDSQSRFQKRMDKMESQVIYYKGFPRSNSVIINALILEGQRDQEAPGRNREVEGGN